MPQDIHFSNNTVMKDAYITVEDDLSVEAVGYYRAYWTTDDSTGSVTVFGYCDRGTHKTIRAVAAEVKRFYPKEIVYRNGKPVKQT